MKRRLLLMGLAGLVLLASCGKDDEPRVPDPLEGKWLLSEFQLTNAPVEFTSWEGAVLPLGQLVTWENYQIEFLADNTFKRRIFLPGADSTDDGVWAKDGETLTITSNDSGAIEEEYNIESVDEVELIWSEAVSLRLIKDAVADTLTQAYVDTLTDEEFDALFVPVNITLNYVFAK
jgi:hypothetical protein